MANKIPQKSQIFLKFPLDKVKTACYNKYARMSRKDGNQMENTKVKEMFAKIPQTEKYLETYKANSPKTAEAYATNLATLVDGLNIGAFEELKDIELGRIYDLAAERGWSKQTINQYVANLQRFLAFCADEGMDVKKLRYKKLKSQTEPTFVFSYAEEEAILNAITSKRLRCMLSLFLEIGSRKSAVQNIKLTDLSGNELTITDKGDKTTVKKLSPELVEMLADYIDTDRRETMERFKAAGGEDKGYLFVANFVNGNPRQDFSKGLRMNDTALNEQVKNAARKAGVKNWQKVVPHSFRKRFGIDTYYSNGMDIVQTQKAMNHASANQTAYYVGKYDITDEEKEQIAAAKGKPNAQAEQIKELLGKIETLTATVARQAEVINNLISAAN